MGIVFTAAEINMEPASAQQSAVHVGGDAVVSITGPVTCVSDGMVCDLSDIFANAIESYPAAILSSDGVYAFQYVLGTDGDPETGYFIVVRTSTGALLSGGVTLSAQNFRGTFKGR